MFRDFILKIKMKKHSKKSLVLVKHSDGKCEIVKGKKFLKMDFQEIERYRYLTENVVDGIGKYLFE